MSSNERNTNVDVVRALALLAVVIYHIFVLTNITFKYKIINNLISFGGELGVSVFFVLSGYSVYKLLERKKENYLDYIKGRLKRIGPHYYISLFVSLVFTSAIAYLTKEHILNIFSHIVLVHNLFYNYHGAINGVLWTMGVIFQFYLIAPFLKKILDKHPVLTVLISICFSIITKYILYYIIFPRNGLNDNTWYFIYGRQLFTTIDAFALGMFISKYEDKNKLNKYLNFLLLIVIIISLIIALLIGSNTFHFLNNHIYSKSIKSIFYFIILDLIIALSIFHFNKIELKNSFILNIILFISRHQFAIYIWHLIMLDNMLNNIKLMSALKSLNIIVVYLLITFVIIMLCSIIDIFISKINYSEIFKKR